MVFRSRKRARAVNAALSGKVKRAKTSKQLASEALRLVKQLRKEQETKYYVLSTSFNAISAPTFVHMTGIAQGTEDFERLGEKATLKWFNLRWQANQNTAGSQPVQFFRIVLLLDRQQADSTTPTASEVFGSAFPAMTTLYKHDNFRRFSILHDKVHAVGENNSTGPYPEMKVGSISVPLRLTDVEWSGTAGSTISKNGLYMLVYSNEATNGPGFIYESRVSYTSS